MRLEARSTVRAAASLTAVALLAINVACGGEQARQEEPAAAPPAPKVLAAAERAAWYQACWADFNNRSWDRFRACYADSVESEQVGSLQPVARGVDAVVANAKAFTEAFPDVKGTGELILTNGDTLLSLDVLNGTHTGPLAGPGAQSIAATNKPIGLLQAHLVQTDATGAKVVKERFYMDSGTMMAQLGLNPGPARPVMTSAAAAPIAVVAGGSPAESANLEAARAQVAAFNRHDAKGVVAFNAPDVVLFEAAAPKDMTSAESLSGISDMMTAFPDAKLVTPSVWAAGDYVVVVGTFEGTNTGPFKAMGLKKATGKAVTVGYIEITRWVSGKVRQDWLIYDGTAFASQLGLMGGEKK